MKKKKSKLDPVDILVIGIISTIAILGIIFLIMGLS